MRLVHTLPISFLFDALLGLVMPILLLLFDLGVFRDSAGPPYLGAYKGVGYLATPCFLGILAWWLATHRLPRFCAGALTSGALFATVIGLALLPISLMFLVIGIGAIGLI